MLLNVLLALLLLSTLTTEAARRPRQDECKDRSKNCKNKLAWCYSDDPGRVQQMKVNCRKSCNYCPEDPRFQSEECKDRSRNCKNKLTWCTSKDKDRVYLMRVNCRKSCNYCDDPKVIPY